MKKIIPLTFLMFTALTVSAQERLLFLGYTKNYVSGDSTHFTFNFDLNMIPGASEKVGGTFFVNKLLKKEAWRFYFKPSADVNIGSGTTTAPNNISIGTPLGFSYDGIKLSELSFEGAPEFVADKTFDNFLFYGTVGTYFRIESKKKTLLNVSVGVSVSNGKRSYSMKGAQSHSYGRFTIPVYTKFAFWEGADPSDKSKKYFKMHLTGTLKINNVYKDDEVITPDPSLLYSTGKLEFYFIPRLAFTVNYTYGYEEPLFKKNNTLSFGLTFASLQ